MVDFRRPGLVALIAFLARSADAAIVANASRSTGAPATGTVSFFSKTDGPWLNGATWTWSQYIVPTTVGTVMVTVNEATNQTSSTTIFHSEVQKNGSLSILTRTDTDAAGTVTDVVQDILGQNTTITFPTAFLDLDDRMTWHAVLPTTNSHGDKCCQTETTHSPTPTHTPFVPVVQSTDSADPRGWLYTLVSFEDVLDNKNITALWSGIPISLPYDGCHFTTCGDWDVTTVAAASAVQSVANLLATSTTTISSAASKTPDATSVEVDPISATPGESPSPSPHATATHPDQQPSPTQKTEPDQQTQPDQKTQPDQQTQQTQPDQQTKPDQQTQPNQQTQPDQKTQPNQQTQPDQQTQPNQQTSPTQKTAGQGQPSDGNTPAPTQTSVNAGGALLSLISALTGGQSTDEQAGATATARVSPAAKAPATIVVGSHTITQQSNSAFVVSSQTLAPGSSVTVGSGDSTTVVELRTSASHTMLVVGTSTSEMEQASPAPQSAQLPPPVVTVGSSVVTANSASEFVIDGHTLAPGSAIVVSGTTVSLASGATELVVGSDTEVAQTTTARGGLGSLIWSGLGGAAAVATSTHSAPGSGLLASTAPVAGGNDNPTASQSDGSSSSSSPAATPLLSSAGRGKAQSFLRGEALVVAVSLVALVCL